MTIKLTPEEVTEMGKQLGDVLLANLTVDDLLARFETKEVLSHLKPKEVLSHYNPVDKMANLEHEVIEDLH